MGGVIDGLYMTTWCRAVHPDRAHECLGHDLAIVESRWLYALLGGIQNPLWPGCGAELMSR